MALDASGLDIVKAASKPLSVRTVGMDVTMHPLVAQIQADRYIAATQASKRKSRGLRITRLIGPPQQGPVDYKMLPSDMMGLGF